MTTPGKILYLLRKIHVRPIHIVIPVLFAMLAATFEGAGMGLLIPGFIPSPLGDVNEYTPSLNEFLVCLGIWALGALIYTTTSKVAISIELGKLSVHPK